MNVKLRQELERKIARRLVKDLLAAGFTLTINNGGDEYEISPTNKVNKVLKAMFATDDEHLIVLKDGKRFGWAYFVYGNDGYDVISDYTTNLDPYMAGANKISDKYA